jgi:hypothetical protein
LDSQESEHIEQPGVIKHGVILSEAKNLHSVRGAMLLSGMPKQASKTANGKSSLVPQITYTADQECSSFAVLRMTAT